MVSRTLCDYVDRANLHDNRFQEGVCYALIHRSVHLLVSRAAHLQPIVNFASFNRYFTHYK